MKIVDKEGRLFGKLNIIDAAVIAIVVLMIPTAVVIICMLSGSRIRAIEAVRSPIQAMKSSQRDVKTISLIRWKIPAEILNVAKTHKKFDKIEPSKQWIYDPNQGYVQVEYPGTYWGYAWEDTDWAVRIGSRIVYTEDVGRFTAPKDIDYPLDLEGYILDIRLREESVEK